MRTACWIHKATHTHTHTHTRTHAHTHTHTHTHIHTQYETNIAFALPQWLHKHAPMLRYKYIACLVSNTLSY